MSGALGRLDESQTGAVPWLVAEGILEGDLFCTFNHSAPWAGVLFAVTMLVPIGSVLLHGAWRLRLVGRSLVAIATLAVAAFMFMYGPALLLNQIGAVINFGSAGVGLIMWWLIVQTPRAKTAQPAYSANRHQSMHWINGWETNLENCIRCASGITGWSTKVVGR